MKFEDFKRFSELNRQADGNPADDDVVLETTIDKAFPFLFGKGG